MNYNNFQSNFIQSQDYSIPIDSQLHQRISNEIQSSHNQNLWQLDSQRQLMNPEIITILSKEKNNQQDQLDEKQYKEIKIQEYYHDLIDQQQMSQKNYQQEPIIDIYHTNNIYDNIFNIFDQKNFIEFKSLTPYYINKLISLRGVVIRCSSIYPQIKKAVFVCIVCKFQTQVKIQNFVIKNPLQCYSCKRTQTMQIVHNYCKFSDKQYIKIQQFPQKTLSGQIPQSIRLISYDKNVDQMKLGDRVQIVGIYRVQIQKISKNNKSIKSLFNVYVDLVSFKFIQNQRLKSQLGSKSMEFSQKQKQQFKQMASKEKIVDDLVNSFAVSIYGHQDIKKGILAQMFGGTNKNLSESLRGRLRSEINVCLVGDPSTAKSQLLQQVSKIIPRGVYLNGRGSTTVGLTPSIKKDPETNEFILQNGALILSDLSICCIDQLDKMDTTCRQVLSQVMQQQTISIAKAGIICRLNSRTSILAAANPIKSKCNPKKLLSENTNLQCSLLSKFDLIYVLLDKVDLDYHQDIKLAKHILKLYSAKNFIQTNIPIYSKQKLSRYIAYARQYCNPTLTEDSSQKLVKFYTQMRNIGIMYNQITIDPNKLESMIRISQAFAKMRLSNYVQSQDVQMSIQLINNTFKKIATDPNTGFINMDIIISGKTYAKIRRISELSKLSTYLFREMLPINQLRIYKTVDYLKYRLLSVFEKQLQQINDNQLIEAIIKLQKQGTIYKYNKKNKKYKVLNIVKQQQ